MFVIYNVMLGSLLSSVISLAGSYEIYIEVWGINVQVYRLVYQHNLQVG